MILLPKGVIGSMVIGSCLYSYHFKSKHHQCKPLLLKYYNWQDFDAFGFLLTTLGQPLCQKHDGVRTLYPFLCFCLDTVPSIPNNTVVTFVTVDLFCTFLTMLYGLPVCVFCVIYFWDSHMWYMTQESVYITTYLFNPFLKRFFITMCLQHVVITFIMVSWYMNIM